MDCLHPQPTLQRLPYTVLCTGWYRSFLVCGAGNTAHAVWLGRHNTIRGATALLPVTHTHSHNTPSTGYTRFDWHCHCHTVAWLSLLLLRHSLLVAQQLAHEQLHPAYVAPATQQQRRSLSPAPKPDSFTLCVWLQATWCQRSC